MQKYNRIVCITDILMHDYSQLGTNHQWFFKLVEYQIRSITNLPYVLWRDIVSFDSDGFKRHHFFKLSGISKISAQYFIYDADKVSEHSYNYLTQFISKEDIVIGMEMSASLCAVLDRIGITYINVAIHPFKLLDDIVLLFNSNNMKVNKALQIYALSEEKLYMQANYWCAKLQDIEMREKRLAKLSDNSAIFIAQTSKDQSLVSNGKMLSILDFEEKIIDIQHKYSQLYYIPHPIEYPGKAIKNFLQKRKIIKLDNINTYALLSADAVSYVFGISSSVLYEAQFFGKKADYLYKPLYNICSSGDDKNIEGAFISVYNEYLHSKFWSDILGTIYKTKTGLLITPETTINRVRDIRDMYWNFSSLDAIAYRTYLGKLYNKIQQHVSGYIRKMRRK